MPDALSRPSPSAAASLTADDILAAGQELGQSPGAQVSALLQWRDDVMTHGRALYDEAPERRADWYWTQRAKLDQDVWATQQKLLAEESARIAASVYPEPGQQKAAWGRIESANWDEDKLAEGDRRLLSLWSESVELGQWQLPTTPVGEIRNQPIKSGDTTLATYDVRAANTLGDFEARIKLGPDASDPSATSRVVDLPTITPERIKRELAATRNARNAREAELAQPIETGGFADSSFASGPVAIKRTQEQIDGDGELSRLKLREALLSSPGAGAVLLNEDVEAAIKSDPALRDEIGKVALGSDIWRGVVNGVLRTGYAADDIAKLIKGDDGEGIYNEADAEKLSEALQSIEEAIPGSTRWKFQGGVLKTGMVQGAQALGEMVPSMIGPQIAAKGALVAAGKAGLIRTGVNPGVLSSLGGIGPMAYGGTLAATDAEIAAETDPERRTKLEKGRRARAAWTAVSEIATESLFRGQMLFRGAVPSVRQALIRRGISIAEEGVEEVIQKGIETNVIDPATIGRYDPAKLEDYLTSFVAGAVAAGGIQTLTIPAIPGELRAQSEQPAPAASSPPPSSAPPPGATPPPGPAPEPTSKGPASGPAPAPEPAAAPGSAQGASASPPAKYVIGSRVFTNENGQWRERLLIGENGTEDGSKAVDPFVEPEVFMRLQAAKAARENSASSAPATGKRPGSEATEPAKPEPRETAGVPRESDSGTVSSGKPNGAKAIFRYRVIERAEIAGMLARDIGADQTRQRAGNVASDEQVERIATGIDPDFLLDSRKASDGAPVVAEGTIIAGNGRSSGIMEAYERGLAAAYESAVREFAESRGISTEGIREPVLIRDVVEFTQGDRRAFVIESNPKRGGMGESVSEQALLDADAIGEEMLARLEFTSTGDLSAASLAAVAQKLEAANRGITRTLRGRFDPAEATRRVMAAYLSRLVSRAGRDASDVSALLETDGGKRAVTAIAEASPRLAKLDDDLSLAAPLVDALMALKSGAQAVRRGDFKTLIEWHENRANELLAADLDPIAESVLRGMAETSRSAKMMNDFLREYLEAAEAEQFERDKAAQSADIFGDERVAQTPEDIFAKLGRTAAETGAGSGVTSDGQGAREVGAAATQSTPDPTGLNRQPDPVESETGELFDVDPDAFDQELDDLIAEKERRFPRQERPLGGLTDTASDQFFTPSEFERAFIGFVNSGNFRAAREAVRDSDKSAYVEPLKSWMRGAKAGDPDATRYLEWFRHINSGTVPPGIDPVTERPFGQSPPPPPAPGPRRPGPPPQQQKPPPPPPPPPPVAPPPPPRPSDLNRFNMPALVYLAETLGAIPLVRRMKARGSYTPSAARGDEQTDPVIKLNEFLGKMDWQQAARTLAHEIGHLIDYVVMAIPNAGIVNRLLPLQAARDAFIASAFSPGSPKQFRDTILDEAVRLSKIMRGDFVPGTQYGTYRMQAAELYADFVSALLINPDLAYNEAPFMTHAFMAGLEAKEDAWAAWNLLQDILQGDILFDAIRERRVGKQSDAMEGVIVRADQKAARSTGWRRISTALHGMLWSRYVPAGSKKGAEFGGFNFVRRWWDSTTNPKEKDFVARMEGAEIYAAQKSSALHARLDRDVYHTIERHGISGMQLDEYLTYQQIIEEDTAALSYLRDNPDEFREFLHWLADAGGLASFHDEIDSVADTDLDDLGAKMVGRVQMENRFEEIYNAARRTGAPDIAERGIFAFDISRYQWNQAGFTPETARQGMDFLRKELGDARFKVLKQAAGNFHGHIEEVVRDAYDSGLFTDRVWQEKIEPNLGNYVPRMVLDYVTGEVSASIKQRRGSVKDTLPKHLAGEAQAMTLLQKIGRQKQMSFIFEQAFDARWDSEIEIIAPRDMAAEQDRVRLAERDGKGIRGFYRKGRWHMAIFEDADVVKFLDTYSFKDWQGIYRALKANENFWRVMMTVARASFVFVNNPTRMALELPFAYGVGAWVQAFRSAPLAWNWARASLGMAEPREEVVDLVDRGVLMPFGQYVSADLTMDADEMIERALAGAAGMAALNKGTGSVANRALAKTLDAPGIKQVVDLFGLITGFIEALPKATTEQLLKKRGAQEWERTRLARMEGIPNTGLSAGKLGTMMGVFSLFYRVTIQGARRMANLPFNPRTRARWWTSVAVLSLLPKAFYLMAANGALDALFDGDDDDEKQKDWQEAYTRISRYKIAHTDALFVGWLKPDGGYELPFGHSTIPANWTPVMKRMPYSESGRHTSPMAAFLLWNLWPGSPLESKDKLKDVRDLAQSFLPDANPLFGGPGNSLLNPTPPIDPYSGREIVPEDEWEQGFWSRMNGMAKYYLAQTPAGDFMSLPPQRQNEALPDWAKTLLNVPGMKAVVALDNDPLAADFWRRVDDQETIARKARGMRGPLAQKATSLLSKLEAIKEGDRTSQESDKINILRGWRNGVYEDTMNNVLRPFAAGMKGLDAEGAVKLLEQEAKTTLEMVGQIER